jgi:hypothetical protein
MRNDTRSLNDIYSPAHREAAMISQGDYLGLCQAASNAGWLNLALDALDLRAEDIFGEADGEAPSAGIPELSDLGAESATEEACGSLSAEDIELLRRHERPPVRTL